MQLLAALEFDRLLERCVTSRLSAADIETVLRQYGATPIAPPREAYDRLDAVRTNATRPTWSVGMELWSKEQGRTDLTVELTITLDNDEASIEFDDTHVL